MGRLPSPVTIFGIYLTIEDFNLGNDKVAGICRSLNCDRAALINLVDACYGDDPLGNDKGILDLRRAFVIRNDNNQNCPLPTHLRLTDWQELSKIL
jgi:hypothetical protein